MTEVVTNGAAFMQPFLQPNRQQVFGVSNPDSPQVSLQIAAEASRTHAAVAAQEVPRASEDRSSLQNDSLPQSNPQAEPFRLKAAADNAPAPANTTPTGPSKARVDLPPLQLAQPGSASATQLTLAAPAPHVDAPSAPAPEPAPAAPAADEAPKLTPGALGAAATLSTLSLENLSQNIIGVAFAPTQVVQAPQTETVAAQPQKNFIFAQRKLYAEAEQSGKFVAQESRRHVIAEEAKTPKFAVQAAAQVVVTVASGKFATHEEAQKLSDKTPQHETSAVENGESRLYDKVAQTDAGSRFAQEDAQQHAHSQGRGSSRESLYQRAEAIAYALGNKAENPEVKKLFADIARYRATVQGGVGTTPAAVVSPSVIVTA